MACYSWNFQDYLQQPPAQELVARDLHDQEWHFRHIYRGEQCLEFFLWTSVGESDLQLDTCYCRFFSSYFMKSPTRSNNLSSTFLCGTGKPRRHLLTTGWSIFVNNKRLQAGDSVLFIRDDQGQLLLGIRRVQRQQTIMPSSMLSSDSMHIGVLAAANHAATTNSRFTIFYNPRY
jgi:hypothetical protein